MGAIFTYRFAQKFLREGLDGGCMIPGGLGAQESACLSLTSVLPLNSQMTQFQ